MIKAINAGNQKINFCGTTIINKEGGSILTGEILDAVNQSSTGYCNTRFNGYSIVVVSDIFKKEEKNFLKELSKKCIEYVHFSKVFDHKMCSLRDLVELAKDISKVGLL